MDIFRDDDLPAKRMPDAYVKARVDTMRRLEHTDMIQHTRWGYERPDLKKLLKKCRNILIDIDGFDDEHTDTIRQLDEAISELKDDNVKEPQKKKEPQKRKERWWSDGRGHDEDEQKRRERRALHNITYNLTRLTDALIDQLEVWIHERESIPAIKAATAGNRYVINIYPTGIGEIYTVKDPVGPEENNEIDLTDLESW